MTITPASRRQWEIAGRDEETGRITCYQILFAGGCLVICRANDTQPWRVVYEASHHWQLLDATTPEEAGTEAVVAISQHLDRLRDDLATIPITLPPTP